MSSNAGWRITKPKTNGGAWVTLISRNTGGRTVFKQLSPEFVGKMKTKLPWGLTPRSGKWPRAFVRMKTPTPQLLEDIGRTLGLESNGNPWQFFQALDGDQQYTDVVFSASFSSWKDMTEWWRLLEYVLDVKVIHPSRKTCWRECTKDNVAEARFCEFLEPSDERIPQLDGIKKAARDKFEAVHAAEEKMLEGRFSQVTLAEREHVQRLNDDRATLQRVVLRLVQGGLLLLPGLIATALGMSVDVFADLAEPLLERQVKATEWFFLGQYLRRGVNETVLAAMLHKTYPDIYALLTTREVRAIDDVMQSVVEHVDEDLCMSAFDDERCVDIDILMRLIGRNLIVVHRWKQEPAYWKWAGDLWVETTEVTVRVFARQILFQWWKAFQRRNHSRRFGEDEDRKREFFKFCRHKLRQVQEFGHVRQLVYSLASTSLCGVREFQSSVPPEMMSVANGMLDLRTLEITKRTPQMHIRWACPVRYVDVGNDKLELMDKFVATYFCEDHLPAEQRFLTRYFQTTLGYGLTGCKNLQKCFFWINRWGSNGKTTLIALICKVVGKPMAQKASKRIFVERRGRVSTDENYEIALADARMGICEELEEDDHVDRATLKRITGSGEEEQMLRALYKGAEGFVFRYKLYIATNALPKMEVDDAMKRRLVIIPFLRRFYTPAMLEVGAVSQKVIDSAIDEETKQPIFSPVDDKTLNYLQDTEDGRRAVLAWLVRGAQRYFALGKALPPMPKRARERTKQYFTQANMIAAFVADCCVEYYRGVADRAVFEGGEAFHRGVPRNFYVPLNNVVRLLEDLYGTRRSARWIRDQFKKQGFEVGTASCRLTGEDPARQRRVIFGISLLDEVRHNLIRDQGQS